MTAPSSAAGPTPDRGRGQALLREIHDLRALYSRDKQLAQWADAVHRIYRQATAFSHTSGHTSGKQRRAAQLALEKRLLALCRPCLDDPLAVQGKLCRRIDKHLKSLPRT